MVNFARPRSSTISCGTWGKAAIRAWAERDIIGERLTTAVTKVVKHYDNFIAAADIDENV
jgi:hypothetical protein